MKSLVATCMQVLNGVLMRAIDNPGNAVLDAVEGMLVVAVHLYDIPDVDFLVHWWVACPLRITSLQYAWINSAVQARTPEAGAHVFGIDAHVAFLELGHQMSLMYPHVLVLYMPRGDGTTRDVPVLSFNIDRSQPHAGWQLPYWEHWQDHALSLAQSLVWSECTRTR
jgi:hypothetical protein